MSVVVPVALVGGVPVPVVNVVGVVAVRDGDVAAPGTVLVGVTLMGRVCVGAALVDVAPVSAVDVPVVGVVGVVAVREGDVAATLAMDVLVGVMRVVRRCGGHWGSSSALSRAGRQIALRRRP